MRVAPQRRAGVEGDEDASNMTHVTTEQSRRDDGIVVSKEKLAKAIREQHLQVHRAIATGLRHAIECGRLLKHAKESLPHGQYIPFITNKCVISKSTAAGYIRCYEHRDRLLERCNAVAPLSFRQAIKLLAEPKSSGSVSIDTEVPVSSDAADLDREQAEDDAKVAELKRTLDRPDVTIGELKVVIDTATLLMSRAVVRRQRAEQEYDRIVPPGVTLVSEETSVAGHTLQGWIVPSTDPTYVYVNVVRDLHKEGATVDGTKKPIHRTHAWLFLKKCGFPAEAIEWRVVRDEQPWSYNQWLYDSHDDYVKRAVLGADLVYNHLIVSTPDEAEVA